MKQIRVLAGILAVFMMVAAPTLAQDAPPLIGQPVIGGLSAPRGLAFDASGNLFVAIAGSGGEKVIRGETVDTHAGLTGYILSIAPDGTTDVWLDNLPSYDNGSETVGLYRAIPKGDSLWVVYSYTIPGAFWGNTIAELDIHSKETKRLINLTAYETANNPDGNEINSNVSDLAWGSDGTMYITDAGANTLYSWTAEAGLAVVQSWPDNAVPTSVEIAENGDIYVGFLGAALAPGAGKIEHWSGGALVETFGGLNAVSDILLDGDRLYAVQLVILGEDGPGPGSVVRVTAEGTSAIAQGLTAPFGIAKGPDGSLYVSFGTIASYPGSPAGVVKYPAPK